MPVMDNTQYSQTIVNYSNMCALLQEHGKLLDWQGDAPKLTAFMARVAALEGVQRVLTDQTRMGVMPSYIAPAPK